VEVQEIQWSSHFCWSNFLPDSALWEDYSALWKYDTGELAFCSHVHTLSFARYFVNIDWQNTHLVDLVAHFENVLISLWLTLLPNTQSKAISKSSWVQNEVVQGLSNPSILKYIHYAICSDFLCPLVITFLSIHAIFQSTLKWSIAIFFRLYSLVCHDPSCF